MISDQDLLVTQFVTLWAVLDPIGHLSLFLGATAALSAGERRKAALLSIVIAFAILVVFGFGGQYLLHAMDVSLLSFQIAGGIILFVFAVEMVLGAGHGPGQPPAAKEGETDTAETAAATPRRPSALDIAVYPLAVPIIAGPGAILTIIVLMDNNRHQLERQFATMGVLGVVMVLMLGLFMLGGLISRVIGVGGANVLRRVMGLVIAAVAVNLILNALSQWLKLPPI